MASNERILALVLAGGAGTRMAPLTEHRAKPALPYAGMYRLIDFPLSNCAHSGISDVWVLEQYQPYALGRHLAGGRPWDLDRTHGGLQVLFPHQGDGESGWHQGNADAIYRNRATIAGFDPDVVVVLSADHVYKLDYRMVVDVHRAGRAGLTMVTTVVPFDHARRFGNVEVDPDGRVRRFVYKPDEPVSDIAATEVFVFDGPCLLETVDELASRAGGDDAELEDFGDELIPHLVDRGEVREHRFSGYWRDVGTLESYWASHMDLLGHDPLLKLDDRSWPVRTTAETRPPARCHGSASIDDALLSPGCVVGGRVERSVLGPGVVVEEGAHVQDSVLLDGTVVEAGASVSGVICDMHVRIGGHARVGDQGGAGRARSDDDLVVLGEGVEVAGGTEMEPGTRESGPGTVGGQQS